MQYKSNVSSTELLCTTLSIPQPHTSTSVFTVSPISVDYLHRYVYLSKQSAKWRVQRAALTEVSAHKGQLSLTTSPPYPRALLTDLARQRRFIKSEVIGADSWAPRGQAANQRRPQERLYIRFHSDSASLLILKANMSTVPQR